VKRSIVGAALAASLLLAPFAYAQTAAQELLQLLQSPAPPAAASKTTAK